MPSGLQTTVHVADLEPRVFVEEILGMRFNRYRLKGICRIVQTPQLQIRVPIANTLGVASTDVGELEEPDISMTDYTYNDVTCTKTMAHIALSDEAVKRANFTMLDIQTRDAGRQIAKSINQSISTEMQTASGTSGSDWSGANNPADDVLAAKSTILKEDRGYAATDLALHPDVYAALISNDDVAKETTHTDVIRIGGLQAIYGLNIVVDVHLPDTEAYVLDRNEATMFFDGGLEGEKYRDAKAKFNGFVMTQYSAVEVVQSGAIVRLTGVSS